jgi:hypothetical protein
VAVELVLITLVVHSLLLVVALVLLSFATQHLQQLQSVPDSQAQQQPMALLESQQLLTAVAM